MHNAKKRKHGDSEAEDKGKGETLTFELYVLSVLRVGLAVADLVYFDIGGVLDLIAEYVDINDPERSNKATQADFDRFARGGF